MEWKSFLLLMALFQFTRYLVLTSLAYGVLWKLNPRFVERHRIQKKSFSQNDIFREIKYSFSTSVIFALVLSIPLLGDFFPATRVYRDPLEYGWLWLISSVLLLMVIHDTYFYWSHRLLHHPLFFRWFHTVHHESKTPSPFSAFSFNLSEAVIQIIWVIPILYLIPLSFASLVSFSTISLVINIIGHSGLELYPKSWRDHTILKYLNTSTHHNLHHQHFKGNYGLYFTWWDRWMGTLIDVPSTQQSSPQPAA